MLDFSLKVSASLVKLTLASWHFLSKTILSLFNKRLNMVSEVLGQLPSRTIPHDVTEQMDAHGRIGAQEILATLSTHWHRRSLLTSATACEELMVVSGRLFSSSTYLVGSTNRFWLTVGTWKMVSVYCKGLTSAIKIGDVGYGG